jgi:hypothetical protein
VPRVNHLASPPPSLSFPFISTSACIRRGLFTSLYLLHQFYRPHYRHHTNTILSYLHPAPQPSSSSTTQMTWHNERQRKAKQRNDKDRGKWSFDAQSQKTHRGRGMGHSFLSSLCVCVCVESSSILHCTYPWPRARNNVELHAQVADCGSLG